MARRSKKDKEMDMPGMVWRILFSILIPVLWLSFLILWLFFYADAYNLYQNLAVFLASILIAFGVLGSVWAFWGMKWGEKAHKCFE